MVLSETFDLILHCQFFSILQLGFERDSSRIDCYPMFTRKWLPTFRRDVIYLHSQAVQRVTLKMKAFHFIETSVNINQSTSRYISQDLNVYQHGSENLRTHSWFFFFLFHLLINLIADTWFQASAGTYVRSVLFWGYTQRRYVGTGLPNYAA
jgi:hypothetical protein